MDLLCQRKFVSAIIGKFYFCIVFAISKELKSLCNFILGLANTGMIPAAKQNGMTALKKKKLKMSVTVELPVLSCQQPNFKAKAAQEYLSSENMF